MEKSAEAFRTISEVSELLDTPAHVLRFWESRFSQVKPLKRAGGRRYYRPSDLALLGGIKKLLHEDGLTIRGVQKILREDGVRHVAALSIVDISQLGGSPDVAEEPAAPAAARPEPAPPRTSPFGEVSIPPAATPTLWPESPPPDRAAGDDALLPDPDDPSPDYPDEAPMLVDAPMLPLGGSDNVWPLSVESKGREKVAPPAAPKSAVPTGPMVQPAAAMLRAMDALRARDKKTELRTVYDRLTLLRARLAARTQSSQK